MILPHITLNTGHIAEIDLSRVDPSTRRSCAVLWPHGGLLPSPLGGSRVTFGGTTNAASVAIWRGDEPRVIFGVCFAGSEAEGLWVAIERQYLEIAKRFPGLGVEYVEMPPTPPWIVVVMLPGLLMASKDEILTMARIEQAFAAALCDLHS